ncbi:hypothetical protein LXL04_038146 [Taraxacum kok-saghyz]
MVNNRDTRIYVETQIGKKPRAKEAEKQFTIIDSVYKGKNSSDEEDLNDVPDDDEYDTEDSFIDDTELDEYFQVDNSAIKHDGFFVNRGKLERTLKGFDTKNNDGHVPNKHMKVNKKESKKAVAPIDKNAPTPSRSALSPTLNFDDMAYKSPIIALGTVVKTIKV